VPTAISRAMIRVTKLVWRRIFLSKADTQQEWEGGRRKGVVVVDSDLLTE
jgi:hypothetical protein